jgi:hypothetical protein
MYDLYEMMFTYTHRSKRKNPSQNMGEISGDLNKSEVFYINFACLTAKKLIRKFILYLRKDLFLTARLFITVLAAILKSNQASGSSASLRPGYLSKWPP